MLKIVYINENTEEKNNEKNGNQTLESGNQKKFGDKSPVGSLIKKLISIPVLISAIAMDR